MACEINLKGVYHEKLQQIKYLKKHISQVSLFLLLVLFDTSLVLFGTFLVLFGTSLVLFGTSEVQNNIYFQTTNANIKESIFFNVFCRIRHCTLTLTVLSFIFKLQGAQLMD